LHQLLAPMLDRVEGLPAPQRDALRTAFGVSPSSPPDRFFVALAVLSLLSDVAEERPLICVPWSDSRWARPSARRSCKPRPAHALYQLLSPRSPMDVHAGEQGVQQAPGPDDGVVGASIAKALPGIPLAFPIRGRSWEEFALDQDLVGADDGTPGRSGWRFRRSASHVHQGIDLRGRIGAEIVAIEDGEAEYRSALVNPGRAGWNCAGNRVQLTGDSGAAYQYFHLGISNASTVAAFPRGISSGDVIRVAAGETIGYLGYSGGSAATLRPVPPHAAHLHFEFHPDGCSGEDANPARLFELILTAAGHSRLRPSALRSVAPTHHPYARQGSLHPLHGTVLS
jgi:murein DD-endopeptidase MepM/ murein hydrolase activator NlpD